MSYTPRMPGESERDYMRRLYEERGLDPDLAGPATDGPRFAGESERDWMERLIASRRPFAPRPPKTDDDSDTDGR